MSCVITGLKPGGLPDPDVALNPATDWLPLQISNGKVVRVHPNQLSTGGGGAALTPFEHIVLGFNGTEIALPLSVNGGKFPTDPKRVKVTLNGNRSYRTVDHNVQYNPGVGVQDKILFTNPTSGDVLIEFEA